MPHAQPRPALRLSRRRMLTSVGVVTVVATAGTGCEWGPDPVASSDPAQSPGTVPDAQAADRALIVQALAQSQQALAVVRAAQRSATVARESHDALVALVALHESHLALLRPSVQSDGDEAAPVTSARLSRVRRVEHSLQELFIDLSGRAASGALARTFAAMAAGVAQHLVVLEGAG